jgi:threonylcarbamoyladenosine tRNA methylthiotransferase MtaB
VTSDVASDVSAQRSVSTPKVVTFGCRLNAYESEVIAKLAADAGLSDTIIVNTCAVTGEAERQARQAIRRLKRERPTASIVVTGCAAQIDPGRFAAMPEVARVVGNAEKLKSSTWQNTAPIQVADIMQLYETAPHLLPAFAGHTRAFVEIQQGCDHRCTFCIIPFGRGPSRSAPLDTVVEHVRHYVAGGAREVVLTGVDLTSWGQDLPEQPGLPALIRRLLSAVPELPRLRLSSLDPAEIDDGLFELFAQEKRLMPHLHLSLQAGDDLILKRMKRRHTREQSLAMCRRARAAHG